MMKPDTPHYDKRQAAQAGNYLATIAKVEAADDFTVKIHTKVLDGTLVYSMSNICYSSPAQWEAVGRDWDKFALKPSGTGPWKFDRQTPRERVEFVRNASYWDPKRVPKCDRVAMRRSQTLRRGLPPFCPIRWIGSRRPVGCHPADQGCRML